MAFDFEQSKKSIEEYAARVTVLRELLAESESRLKFFMTQMEKEAAKPQPVESEIAKALSTPKSAADITSALTEQEWKESDEFSAKLNHRSGCGHDVSVLRKRFLDYLQSNGGVGQWLSRSQMCSATHAWAMWGKRVVDALLDQMQAEGLVEVKSTNNMGRKIRLRLDEGIY